MERKRAAAEDNIATVAEHNDALIAVINGLDRVPFQVDADGNVQMRITTACTVKEMVLTNAKKDELGLERANPTTAVEFIRANIRVKGRGSGARKTWLFRPAPFVETDTDKLFCGGECFQYFTFAVVNETGDVVNTIMLSKPRGSDGSDYAVEAFTNVAKEAHRVGGVDRGDSECVFGNFTLLSCNPVAGANGVFLLR
jgi:hypothetical protein